MKPFLAHWSLVGIEGIQWTLGYPALDYPAWEINDIDYFFWCVFFWSAIENVLISVIRTFG